MMKRRLKSEAGIIRDVAMLMLASGAFCCWIGLKLWTIVGLLGGEAVQSTGNEKDIIWWLLGIIGALVGLAYKNLLAEMKAIRTLAERSSARMKRLTDGVFLLEAKLHPEDAEEIIEVMNRVIEGDDHNRRT